jgi:hypothetical protein
MLGNVGSYTFSQIHYGSPTVGSISLAGDHQNLVRNEVLVLYLSDALCSSNAKQVNFERNRIGNFNFKTELMFHGFMIKTKLRCGKRNVWK